MEIHLSDRDKKRIQKAIRKKYKKVAQRPEGFFKYPTGRPGLEALQYDIEFIRDMPESVAASYSGVGNPFSLGPINAGEDILDIGCGAGIDAFLAAIKTGPGGKVVGVDLLSEMLDRAEENLSHLSLTNVSFQQASAESLPMTDESFDVVISNGVFNLVPDKAKAFAEVHRVLKPQGRLMIADQLLTGELPEERKQIIKSWAQ